MNDSLYTKCDPSLLALIPLAASSTTVEELAPLTKKRALVMKRGAAKKTVKKAATIAKAVVFVECDHDKTQLSCSDADDVRVNTVSGKMRTAYLPLTSLGKLAAQDGVRHIVAARKLRRCLDKALPAVNVPAFKTDNKLSGKGVVIGVIDSGIDGKHPSFAGRIHSVWDQTRKGKGVSEGSYGVQYTGAAVTKAVDDEIGHGTHVAGIAASADAKYRGVAHEARLVIVRTSFEDAHILDGIRYVFRVAQDLDMPAVVNLSLGGHWDAHDGSDPLCRGINELIGPGRIVCCAAGNEGTDNIHAQVKIAAGKEAGIRFTLPKDTAAYVALNLWYESPHHALEVAVRTPGGEQTNWQPVILNGNPSRKHMLGSDLVQIATAAPAAGAPNSHSILIELYGAGTAKKPLRGGAWEIRVRNLNTSATRLDGWIIDDLEIQECFFSGLDQALDNMKIGSPGACSSAITVAAFTTRKTWPLEGGGKFTDGVTIGGIATFSSEGPLRDGSRKPDLAAPGQWLVAPRARQVVDSSDENVSKFFLAMQGTSMACPFVTGLVALMLQRDPTLTPQQAKKKLMQNSRIPGKPAGHFDSSWGRGVIDATDL